MKQPRAKFWLKSELIDFSWLNLNVFNSIEIFDWNRFCFNRFGYEDADSDKKFGSDLSWNSRPSQFNCLSLKNKFYFNQNPKQTENVIRHQVQLAFLQLTKKEQKMA